MHNRLLKSETQAASLTQAALGILLLALLLVGTTASAETVVEEIAYDDPGADSPMSVEPIEPLSAEELGDLVGPIALYPDDLVAIVLPASTYPLQVVQAARFLEAREDDDTLQPSEQWDDSIVALLNYPEVVELMNDDLDWTWNLGEAVLIQQEEVLAAVSDFRERARVAGNLKSDKHQIVEVIDDGAIEIRPADPEVIYVPYYEPSRVVVYHDYPVYYYYPRRYPVYYYPYPADYAFSTGFFWGVTSAFSIGWSTHHLHLHHYGYYGHPYYGRSYYYDRYYYRRPYVNVTYNYYTYNDRYGRVGTRHHAGNYWYPHGGRHGASPRYRERLSRHVEHDGARRRTDRHRDRQPDRYQHQTTYRDDGTSRNFAGIRDHQREQLVADEGPTTARVQRRQRSARLDDSQRANRNPARRHEAVTQTTSRRLSKGSNSRSGLAGARVNRDAARTDRARTSERFAVNDQQSKPSRGRALASQRTERAAIARQTSRPARIQPAPQRQVPASAVRARPLQARSQQARASHSRPIQARAERPRRTVAKTPQPKQSQPRQKAHAKQSPRPKQSQPRQKAHAKQSSQSQQVASASRHGRGAEHRASRGGRDRGVKARSFRSQR